MCGALCKSRMKKLNIFGCLFIVFSVVLFFLGKMTYGFIPVSAKVESISRVVGSAGGGGAMPKAPLLSTGRSPTQSWVSVKYSYEVQGSRYSSSVVGLYIPANLDLEVSEVGGYIRAYVAPFNADISVLKQGADLRLILLFLMLGCCCLVFHSWLQKMLARNA